MIKKHPKMQHNILLEACNIKLYNNVKLNQFNASSIKKSAIVI